MDLIDRQAAMDAIDNAEMRNGRDVLAEMLLNAFIQQDQGQRERFLEGLTDELVAEMYNVALRLYNRELREIYHED